MGMWLLTVLGEKDTMIIEEIAKLYGVSIQTVTEYYKEMIEKMKNETKN